MNISSFKFVTCLVALASFVNFANAVSVDAPQQIDNDRLVSVGKNFRKSVESSFLIEEGRSAQRFQNLTDLCRRHPFVGLTISELEKVMAAAGQRDSLGSGRNLNSAPGAADENDLLGSVVIYRNQISYSIFNIQFRPKLDETSGVRRIAMVISCGVVSNSL